MAATDSAESVALVLDALGSLPPDVELVVAYDPSRIRPPTDAVWLEGTPGAEAAHLRALGFLGTTGGRIAFLEDGFVPEPGWLDSWLGSADGSNGWAASGSVRLPDLVPSRTDRAVFLCEYLPFLEPLPDPPDLIAGPNFAAARDVPDAVVRETGELQEWRVAAQARRRLANPEARVICRRRSRWSEAFRDRLRFGWSYGRRSGRPRVLGLVAFPLIWFVQAARLLRALRRDRRSSRVLQPAVPLALSLLAAWALGEAMGVLAGPPRGASPQPGGAGDRPSGPGLGRDASEAFRDRVEHPPAGPA